MLSSSSNSLIIKGGDLFLGVRTENTKLWMDGCIIEAQAQAQAHWGTGAALEGAIIL